MPDCHCPLKRAARLAPDRPAIALSHSSLSFSALDQMAQQWAKRLQSYRIGKGDRVALAFPSSPELIALFFAIWRCGASFCPLSSRLPPEQIPAALSRLEPKLFITPDTVEERLFSPRFSIPPSAFLFTSGSTGTPKIAILTRDNLLENGATSIPALDLAPGDRWLLSLPLYHVGGIGLVLRCLLACATLSFDERDPAITHLSCVPTHLYRASPVYRKLKCLLLGGAPISHYPYALPVFVTYGLTEMGSIVAVAKKPAPKELYLGRPLPGREVRIDSEGEILVRGTTLFHGYWNANAVERPFDREGWFATGDLGTFDQKKGLSILGRRDWMFISGGENIQPEEIEAELLCIPGIEEAVVIPIDSPEFGKRPLAIVKTSRTDFDLPRMKKILSTQLPKYKIPVALCLADEIPKNGLKIDRKKILESKDSFFPFYLSQHA